MEIRAIVPLDADAVSINSNLQPEAEPVAPLPEVEETKQYCIFRAGRERFCLPVLDVEEVVEWPLLTKLPLAPSFLMGVFNLRGGIVPVIDIAFTEGRRVDLPPKHVIVSGIHDHIHDEYLRLGIAVDEVIGTYTTSDALLVDEAPQNVPHCIGMLRHNDRLALALDLKKLTETFPVSVI